jgi:hypothetical protein
MAGLPRRACVRFESCPKEGQGLRRGERSALVLLALIVGIFVGIFLVGELAGHD